MKEEVKLAVKKIIRIFFVLFVLPGFYFLEFFVRVRFCLIPNQRIGHLAANTDTFLRLLKKNGLAPRTIYIFFIWGPANQQLVDMFKRELTIWQIKSLVQLHYVLLDILERTRFLITIKGDSHPYAYAANTTNPVLSLTADEEERGRKLLEELGIGPEDWYICFHGRDTQYLNSWRPQYQDLFTKTVYRNSNDTDYLVAAEFISEEGGFAFRMGAIVDAPFDTRDNPRIIDYATQFRTDFLDIYLPAKCRFFIGTNSGYGFVPTVVGTPMLMVNMVPPCRVPCGPVDLFIPKLFLKEADNTYLTFQEAKEIGFFKIDLNYIVPELCEEHGLRIIDNTPQDILDGCKDMMEQTAGESPPEEAAWLQQQFYENFLADIEGFEVLGAKIAPRIALKYKDLITGI